MRVATSSARRVTSVLSWWKSSEAGVVATAAIVGRVATSIILSAVSGILASSVMGSTEAITIRTFAGRRCSKSSLRKALSVVGPR